MMRKVLTFVFTAVWVVVCITIGVLYEPRAFGIAVIGQLCIVGLILLGLTDEPATEPERDSCDGCRHDLGGGCCRINAEKECREGGGFELWEEDEK